MSMLDTHVEARKVFNVRVHELKSSYKKDSKVIFCFFEGLDDCSFYGGAINSFLNGEWDLKLWGVGGVKNVLAAYKNFDWRVYKKNQIIFFIDRDMVDIVGSEKLPVAKNIYVTDNYSIENDVVNKMVCERILNELLGFGDLDSAGMDKIKILFEREYSKFIERMVPIMSWIAYWQKNNEKPFLRNMAMKNLFNIQKGKLTCISKPKRCENVTAYIHKACGNITIDDIYDSAKEEEAFRAANTEGKYIRGKYAFWFLIQFCLSIHKDWQRIAPSLAKKPKNSNNLSPTNASALVGHMLRMPRSLKTFLENTIKCYVDKIELKTQKQSDLPL